MLRDFPETLAPARSPISDEWARFGELLGGTLRQAVVDLHGLLQDDHRHFGYRVANEIARFVNLAAQQAGNEPDPLWTALDLALLQKVLPKFHGTQQELEMPLRKLFGFMVTGSRDEPSVPWDNAEGWRLSAGRLQPMEPMGEPRLPRAAGKVCRMLRRLRAQGFTSFIE